MTKSITTAIEAKQEEKARARAAASEQTKKTTKDEKGEKKESKTPSKGFALELEDFGYLKFPVMTEKAITLIEKENKLSFIAHEGATKTNVKKLIEKIYHVRVEKVNVINDMKGRKKVTVKLNKKDKAEELASKIGVI